MSQEKKIKLTPFLTLAIIGASFLIIYTFKIYKENKLDKGSFITYATVELLKENQKKSKFGKIDLVYFYFIKNDSVFHRVSEIPVKGIRKKNIKLNETFKMNVASSDYGVFEVDFDKRIDTIINKKKYQTHIYNTFIHRNIIEQKRTTTTVYRQ